MGRHISEWLPQKINQGGKDSLRQFMPHIGADGQTGAPDHAVSLRDAGETAEGQHNKNKNGMERAAARDPAGNFQNAVIGFQQCVGQTGEWDEEDIEQIKKYHITAQSGNARKPGDNGVIGCLQQPFRLRLFGRLKTIGGHR